MFNYEKLRPYLPVLMFAFAFFVSSIMTGYVMAEEGSDPINLSQAIDDVGLTNTLAEAFGKLMVIVGVGAVAGLVVYVIRRSGGLFKAISKIFGG